MFGAQWGDNSSGDKRESAAKNMEVDHSSMFQSSPLISSFDSYNLKLIIQLDYV